MKLINHAIAATNDNDDKWAWTVDYTIATAASVAAAAAVATVLIYIAIAKTASTQLGALGKQIQEMEKDRVLTHKRAQKQTTLEFARVVSRESTRVREKIIEVFQRDGINTSDELTQLLSEQHIDLRRDVRDFLNDLERLGAGCEMGIYDIDTVDHLFNTLIQVWWGRTQRYVEHARSRSPEGRQFECFERMTLTMQQRHAERNPAQPALGPPMSPITPT